MKSLLSHTERNINYQRKYLVFSEVYLIRRKYSYMVTHSTRNPDTYLTILGNSPNPFSTATQIRFKLDDGAPAGYLEIYTLGNELVRRFPVTGHGDAKH